MGGKSVVATGADVSSPPRSWQVRSRKLESVPNTQGASQAAPPPRLIMRNVQTGTCQVPSHGASQSRIAARCVFFLFQNFPTLQKILS